MANPYFGNIKHLQNPEHLFLTAPSKTPNDISGAVFIFGEMCIFLACFLRSGSWSVAMCEDSIVLPSSILAAISFDIITGAIVVVACLARCIFSPESVIASVFYQEN